MESLRTSDDGDKTLYRVPMVAAGEIIEVKDEDGEGKPLFVEVVQERNGLRFWLYEQPPYAGRFGGRRTPSGCVGLLCVNNSINLEISTPTNFGILRTLALTDTETAYFDLARSHYGMWVYVFRDVPTPKDYGCPWLQVNLDYFSRDVKVRYWNETTMDEARAEDIEDVEPSGSMRLLVTSRNTSST